MLTGHSTMQDKQGKNPSPCSISLIVHGIYVRWEQGFLFGLFLVISLAPRTVSGTE